MEIIPGLAGHAEMTVSDADTAACLGSGDVPVLATPRVVALCEEASCRALDGHLDEGMTSVGTAVEVHHIAPTLVGDTVRARAEVERTEGRKVVFTVLAEDGRGAVASGRVVRSVVNRASFLARAGAAPVS